MTVKFDLSALAATKWYEYGIRFCFGGAITVIAGLLAKEFGPVFGGLFLAFPAIFPASATLVEKHEKEKKREAGISNSGLRFNSIERSTRSFLPESFKKLFISLISSACRLSWSSLMPPAILRPFE